MVGEVLSTVNKILLGLWGISLAVLVSVIMFIDEDHKIHIAEGQENYQVQENFNVVEVPKEVETIEPEPEPEVTKESVRLAMVGDVLLHLRLAKYKDFISSFEAVAPAMQNFDYLIANQESPPVGNKYALSGFPQFSSPPHILRDI